MKTAVATALRRARLLFSDPVLRRWTIGRALGRWSREPAWTAGRPPYVNGLAKVSGHVAAARGRVSFADLGEKMPEDSLVLWLAGESVEILPGEEEAIFEREFSDRESLLALHRFAWLRNSNSPESAAWFGAMWRAWSSRFGARRDGWPWHAYTVAERLINVTTFAATHGLPGPRMESLELLGKHGPGIAGNLEYFGELRTGNHLANNGRGLFLGGLALGRDDWTALGARLLLEEAKRIFLPSGILREGSSHYHLLATRWYAEAWHAAKRHGRAEAPELEEIVHRAVAAARNIVLPGGLPLVGDVSPDATPSSLLDWLNDFARYEAEGRAAADHHALARDGWLRRDFGPWHGLWHVAPEGWTFMPGHGHDDCGGFEIHFDQTPLFVDLGRGTYEPAGAADLAARMHNGLTVDDSAPYPTNKPYYSTAFREHLAGPPPHLEDDETGVHLAHSGFSRFGNIANAMRRWSFSDEGFTIEDRLEGRGTHTVRRALHTTQPVEPTETGVRVGNFFVRADAPIDVEPATYWQEYGKGIPATALVVEQKATLPWRGTMLVEHV